MSHALRHDRLITAEYQCQLMCYVGQETDDGLSDTDIRT